MLTWLRDFAWWINPRNWLGETKHRELFRRLEAVEASVQEAHLRLNTANNALNEHIAAPLADPSWPGSHATLVEPEEQIPGDGNS